MNESVNLDNVDAGGKLDMLIMEEVDGVGFCVRNFIKFWEMKFVKEGMNIETALGRFGG